MISAGEKNSIKLSDNKNDNILNRKRSYDNTPNKVDNLFDKSLVHDQD